MTTSNLTWEAGAAPIGLDTALGHLEAKVRLTADAAVRAVVREERAVSTPDTGRGARRRFALTRMEDEVRAVEQELVASRDELARLTAARVRPVSLEKHDETDEHDEADRVRALRWRTEHLGLPVGGLRVQLCEVRCG